MRTTDIALALLTLFTLAPAVRAELALETTAQTERQIAREDGTVEIERVPAERVVPGDDVLYTIRAHNAGKDPARDVVITDPLPSELLYATGSAKGAPVTFSVDGMNFAEPEALRVLLPDGTQRPAEPKDFTHIRWTLSDAIAPGAEHTVEFRARLE